MQFDVMFWMMGQDVHMLEYNESNVKFLLIV